MYTTDHDAFNAVLEELGTLFGKELSNELRTLYWHALKDMPLPQVKARAATHMRFGKFFPKPFELRPPDDKPAKPDPGERAFADGVRRSCDYLEELKHTQGEDAWRREVRLRWADRIIATAAPWSPEYSDAIQVRRTLTNPQGIAT